MLVCIHVCNAQCLVHCMHTRTCHRGITHSCAREHMLLHYRHIFCIRHARASTSQATTSPSCCSLLCSPAHDRVRSQMLSDCNWLIRECKRCRTKYSVFRL